jgi:hypothetical protein
MYRALPVICAVLLYGIAFPQTDNKLTQRVEALRDQGWPVNLDTRAQPHSIHVSLTPGSNVSTSKLGKELEHHCPELDIANDSQKAAYNLEASDMGRGHKRYKFILFKDGDRVFSIETRRITHAVKEVCSDIEKRRCEENPSSCIIVVN